MGWAEMQVTPRVLKSALQCFVSAKDSAAESVPNWTAATLGQMLEYLVLRVEPNNALVWHSASCTARLLKLYKSTSPKHELAGELASEGSNIGLVR